jgi:hypothetical protein
MVFLLRAAFWMALVAAFVPAGFSADRDGAFARETFALLSHPTETSFETPQIQTEQFCSTQSEACAVAEQFGLFSQFIANFAINRTEQEIESRLSQPEQTASVDALLADLEDIGTALQ